MKKSTKCTCGEENKITCPNCSEIKMVILLKNGNNDLKIKSRNGRRYNPAWYNHLSKNNVRVDKLIAAMERRFRSRPEFFGTTNMINFYSNVTGQLIKSVKI